MRLGLRRGEEIQSAWLIRVLAGSRRVHHCGSCGARMFVKAVSGLCPLCFTRRRRRDEHLHDIAQQEAQSALHDWT